MIKLIRILALLSLLAIHVSASAQSLWSGTVHGMSPDQVKSIFTNAQTPDKPNILSSGAQELLRVENVEITNKKFTASFYFIAEKLIQVTLSLEKGHTFHSATLVFDSLTEALRAKYGQEISRDISRGALNKATATWMAGRTNINVITMSVGQSNALLNINYQVRVARDADKL